MQEYTIHTKPHPKLIKKSLRKAVLCCLIGSSCFLWFFRSGTQHKALFGVGGFVSISLSLQSFMRYRKVVAQRKQQDELIISKKMLTYKSQGKQAFSLPINLIHSISYQEKEFAYGIAVFLLVPFQNNLVIRRPDFALKSFRKRSKAFGCDLFFPYFYEKSFYELQDCSPIKELLSSQLYSKESDRL